MNNTSERFSRTELLLGSEAMQKLAASRVCIFGVGGVGGYVAEALARSGVGAIDLVDNDTVALSNLNRQIIATDNTLGRQKVEVAKERILSINPDCEVRAHQVFYLPETEGLFDFSKYDYIVDAIDTVSGKLAIIVNAKNAGTPVISSMGAGNKLDPTAFRVSDIYKTQVCPLAKVMRRELRKRGIESLKVVYSEELPLTPKAEGTVSEPSFAADELSSQEPASRKRQTPGSVAFVPSVCGLIIASEVVKDLMCGCKA